MVEHVPVVSATRPAKPQLCSGDELYTTRRCSGRFGRALRPKGSRQLGRVQYSAIEYHFRDIGIGVDRLRRILSE
jgi:hypothetical protein